MNIKIWLLMTGMLLGISSVKAQHIETDMVQVELTYESKSILGEGAFWDHKNERLYWVDIDGLKVHIYDPKTKENRSFDTPTQVGTVVPKNKNEAVIALADGVYMLNTDTGAINLLSDVESAMTYNRFNDGKCDPNGNLWVGSMHIEQSSPKANLYKVDPLGKATKMLDSITISNGIVWTQDKKTMYYIDTPTGHIRAFDFDPINSTISNERVAVVVPESLGYPDGMTIDSEDKLWVGLWNGNSVARFDPISGTLMSKIEVPAHNVTSCSFGGKNFEILYITTASVDMTEEEHKKYPLAGSLFEVKPGVVGVKGNFFGK
jgi:sugar lactone lactonase YvrE